MSLLKKDRPPPGQVVVARRQDVTRLSGGKLDMAKGIREDTEDGAKIRRALMRILEGDGSTKEIIDAAKVLLAYGWGKPVEVSVSAEVSGGFNPAASVEALSTEQLEALVRTVEVSPPPAQTDTHQDEEEDAEYDPE